MTIMALMMYIGETFRSPATRGEEHLQAARLRSGAFSATWALSRSFYYLLRLAELRYKLEAQVHLDALRTQVWYISTLWHEHPFVAALNQ